MILPWPFLIIDGMTAFETMNGPLRSMSITWRKSAALISVIGMRLMMPALLTRMSITPTSFSICATMALTCSSFVTSQT